jgi:hypothetical protein
MSAETYDPTPRNKWPPCVVCGRPACNGVYEAAPSGGGGRTLWYCDEHRPENRTASGSGLVFFSP